MRARPSLICSWVIPMLDPGKGAKRGSGDKEEPRRFSILRWPCRPEGVTCSISGGKLVEAIACPQAKQEMRTLTMTGGTVG